MNFSIIRYILGWICNFEAAFMLLPLITAIVRREPEGWAFVITMAICLLIGLPLTFRKPKNMIYYTAESMVTVSLSWIVLSVLGALPFLIAGVLTNPFDAVFETVSGFTTTGASIFSSVEELPHCINVWRCFTHWVGGMGVLVFILSLLPLTGGAHMNLMRAESPGPSVERMLPKVRTTAAILYKIYFAITASMMAALSLEGMPFYDAMCVSFATAGTGGFGVLNVSCGAYTPLQQMTIAVFMILFGVNFNAYFLIVMKNIRGAWSSEEPRVYLAIIAASVGIITLNILHLCQNVGEAFRKAFFQVASIITTTGFSTADFDLWPPLSKTVLVILMLCGACAGSTGGGFKVSRLIILFKSMHKEILLFLHPNMVYRVKMDGKTVEHDTVRSINVFMVVYVMIFAVSVLLISLDEWDLVTNFTAVAATFNNIGPGLSMVGPTCNFAFFSNFSKVVLILDMLAGRLEIFPMLVLFYPGTWRKH